MLWTKALTIVCLIGLAGCGIPPVDTTFISSVPADARSFAVAQKAVRACTDLHNREKVLNSFRQAGFGVSRQQVDIRGGRKIERISISSPDDAVSVLYLGNGCFVGLVNMTPSQSSRLASIWVEAYEAKPNSEFGDGLSDHVSGAWRRYFTEPARFPDKAPYSHRIVIAAYKTWPHGPYDPQRKVGYSIEGIFPDKPGAAVRLSHVIGCNAFVSTGPNSGVILPCSEPDFRPG